MNMGYRVVVGADIAGVEYKDLIKADLEADERIDEVIDAGVAAGEDVEAKRAQIVSDYEAELLNPYQAAELGYVDAVVAPHETRGQLVRALRATYFKREARPAKKHGNMPL